MFKHQLHDDEQLLQMYRKHEIMLLPRVIEIFILIFVPWYLGLKYNYIFSAPAQTQVFLGWTLLVALFALHAFVVWSINVYIVTTKRLLHIEHSGLFRKTVTETPLDRILNVSYETTGFLSTAFQYGNVLVQIVGLEHPLVLRNIPHPAKVKDFIWKIHLEYGGKDTGAGNKGKPTYTEQAMAGILPRKKSDV